MDVRPDLTSLSYSIRTTNVHVGLVDIDSFYVYINLTFVLSVCGCTVQSKALLCFAFVEVFMIVFGYIQKYLHIDFS